MRLFSDVASGVEDPLMRRAIELAERGRGRTAPNPLVGCVVVTDGRVVGSGFHARAGGSHAEVLALTSAGRAARNADVYVTLEPCSHQGLTPPCANALIAAGVARVVIGMPDPTPLAQGGAAILAAAGIRVEFSTDPAPFEELNEGWITRISTGRPHVTVKVAATLDGRVAAADHLRTDLTGPSGSVVTHRLRGAVDAVLVGASTIAADDPALTVRDGSGAAKALQPLRVVLVRERVPPSGARVFTDGAAPAVVLANASLGTDRFGALPPDIDVHLYPEERGLAGALEVLGASGLNSLLIEAGPTLLASAWEDDLIDELVWVTAGGMGGPEALGAIGRGTDITADALRHRFRPLESGIVGDVSVTRWGRASANANVT